MKKLGILVMPLMVISFLASCGGKTPEPPEPEYVTHTFTFEGSKCMINGDYNYTHNIFEKDKNVQYTITPEDGYMLPKTVSGDVNYDASKGVITISEMTSDIKVTATAEPKPQPEEKHTIHLNPNGGVLKDNIDIIENIPDGTKIKKPEVSREGYDAKEVEWYKTPDFQASSKFDFDDEDGVKSDLFLHAKWGNIKQCIVTFYEGNGGTKPVKKNVNYGERPIYYTPEGEVGDTFLGWFTTKDGNTEYKFDQVIKDDNTEIFAKWKSPEPSTTYTITFDAGVNGKFFNNEQKVSYIVKKGEKLLPYIKQLLPPTLEDQTFAYYEYEEKNNAIDYDDVVTSDITLKANYFASSTSKTDDLTKFDWKTIKNISVTGNPSQWFKIGATKKVNVNTKTHTVRIIGFNHDYSELPDDGSNPDPNKVLGITFEFADVITKSDGSVATTITTIWDGEYKISGDNFDYRKSVLNNFLNTDVLNMLPSSDDPNNPDLREVIKPVDKKVGVNKSKTEGSQYYTATSFDGDVHPYPYLFPLAHNEIADNVSWVTEGEGSKYQYYVEHPNQEDRIKRKAGTDGDGEYYWLRSPRTSSTSRAWAVYYDGSLDYYLVYNSAYGAAPAFCI